MKNGKDNKTKKKSEYIIAIILIALPIILGIIILIIGCKEFYKYEENKEVSLKEFVADKLNENIEIKKSENLISAFEKGDIIEFSGKEWVIINKLRLQ